jgi:hypothetical protein
MIDNVRLQVLNKENFENHIIKNNIVDLVSSINTFTGEIKESSKKGKERNLEVRITPYQAVIYGSLHKYENLCNGEINHNYNDFNYNQIKELIPFLTELFDIENNTSLTNLEMGFNLDLDISPKILIDNNVLMYDLKSANKDLKFKGRGDYKEFQKTDYILKIYSKSKQYNLKNHLIRIEIKITKKRKLQDLGVFELEDLLNKEVLLNIFNFLLNEFEKVFIIDDFDNVKIPIKDLEKLNKYTNPNYWIRIRNEKSYKITKRLENDFKLLIRKYNLGKTKQELKDKLVLKFSSLMNTINTDLGCNSKL